MCIVHSNHCNVIVGVFVCLFHYVCLTPPVSPFFYLLVISSPAEPLEMHRGTQGIRGAPVGKHWSILTI